MAINTESFDFDPDHLRKKYREERDKRLRQDGNEQYQEVSGEFSYFIEDPYINDPIEREAIKEEIEVVVIGGGFGGMLAGARLREAGIDDFKIIEKGGDFGGTWYWNRYPGASCDIESYIYFPLLEETGFVPKQKYTNAPETLEYCKVVCEKFKLYENACLQTEVISTDWDEESLRWIVKTNKGDEMKARFIVHSNGPLNRPKLPAIKGINDYKGHTFHTSRWDYEYTGGSSHGDLTGLKDKKVAIIGTGATAVQCVPHLGAAAKKLYVFQRTPSSIDVRNNQPTDPDWISTQKPGWHDERRKNFETLLTGGMVKEDLVSDGWTEAFRLLFGNLRQRAPSKLKMVGFALSGIFSSKMYKDGFKSYMTGKVTEAMDLRNAMQMADFQKMEKVRARADEVVEDKETELTITAHELVKGISKNNIKQNIEEYFGKYANITGIAKRVDKKSNGIDITVDGEIEGELGGVICRMTSVEGIDSFEIGDIITIYGQIKALKEVWGGIVIRLKRF